jgi:hypothetical protein
LTYEAIFGPSGKAKSVREYQIYGEMPFSHVIALGETWQCLSDSFGSESLERFLKANSRAGSKISLDFKVNFLQEATSKPSQTAGTWSMFGWVNNLYYGWDKMKQHFSGELLDVITTYVVNPFQVRDNATFKFLDAKLTLPMFH